MLTSLTYATPMLMRMLLHALQQTWEMDPVDEGEEHVYLVP